MDVWQDTTSSDCDTTKQLAQLFIVAHCQLDVTGHDAGLLVITSGVACQLKDLSSKIFQNCCLQNSVKQRLYGQLERLSS